MADFLPPHLASQVPSTLSDVQKALAQALVRHGCVARIGQGPVLGTNSKASYNCRICLDTLAGELTLRHEGAGQDGQPPCRRTYHFTCLVDWAESNLTQRRPITCPSDRQLLIPDDVRLDLYTRFRMSTAPDHARIRPIENAIHIWDVVNPNAANPPIINFGVYYIHPENALRMASMGFDAGLIDGRVISILPLLPEVRDSFELYHSQLQPIAPGPHDRNGGWERVFQTWIYVEMGRQFVNQDTGVEAIDIMLIPMRQGQVRAFRRYLLGLLGQVWHATFDRNAGLMEVFQDRLSIDDVINLHAETEIRRMMQRDRAASILPDGVWFWPFPNQEGGISIGGTMNWSDHPARGYELTGLNVGQSNDQRFAQLATYPLWDGPQRSNDLVDQYRRGILPAGFSPTTADIPGLLIGYNMGVPNLPPVVPFVPGPTGMGGNSTPGPVVALNHPPPTTAPQPIVAPQPVQQAQPQQPAQPIRIEDHPDLQLPVNPFTPGQRAPDPGSFGIPNPFIRPPQ